MTEQPKCSIITFLKEGVAAILGILILGGIIVLIYPMSTKLRMEKEKLY